MSDYQARYISGEHADYLMGVIGLKGGRLLEGIALHDMEDFAPSPHLVIEPKDTRIGDLRLATEEEVKFLLDMHNFTNSLDEYEGRDVRMAEYREMLGIESDPKFCAPYPHKVKR